MGFPVNMHQNCMTAVSILEYSALPMSEPCRNFINDIAGQRSLHDHDL